MISDRAAAAHGLTRVERWNREDIRRFQGARLRALARHAYERVPFYRNHWVHAGLHGNDVRGLQDLTRIPLITKADLQAARVTDVVARGLDPSRLVVHRTSGSTGKPLTIRLSLFEERLLQAFRLRVMFGYGMRWRDRRAALRGENSLRSGWWTRLGLLPVVNLGVSDPDDVLRSKLLSLKPDVVEGVASLVAAIAEGVTDADRCQWRPRFVAVGAEPLTPGLRHVIERGFGTRVYDILGSHEFNLIAAECPSTGLLHVADTSLVAEVLRDGRPAKPGETGELVATALHSYAMPFIRLRTGDWVRRGPEACPCGAPFGTLEVVEGRVTEIFRLPDGRKLHPASLIRPLTRDAPPWLAGYQLLQERADFIRLYYVAEGEPADLEDTLRAWLQCADAWAGGQIRLVAERVRRIPTGPGGKRPLSRSLVP